MSHSISPEASDAITLPLRPALQRTELGPMVHVVAHEVADRIEQSATVDEIMGWFGRGDHDHPPSSLTEEEYSYVACNGLLRHAEAHLGQVLQEGSYTSAHKLISDHRDPSDVLGISKANLTHWTSFYKVALEGVTSGLVMPSKVYRAIKMYEYERDTGHTPNWRFEDAHDSAMAQPMDVDDYLCTLRSPEFNGLLHQLSHAPNGHYGVGSTHVNIFPDRLRTHDGIQVFEHDVDELPRLSEQFMQAKSAALRDTIRNKQSGGCPARHARFTKLGPYATELLTDLGLGAADLPAESAISRCRRLVATVTDRALSAEVIWSAERE